MRRTTKIAALAALPVVGLGIATAGAANAAPAPSTNSNASTPVPDLTSSLDTPDYIHYATNCTPGMTTHTDYKWVPNVSNAGPTMWTVTDWPANTAATFIWKGTKVPYHRDGTKTQQATDTQCGVSVTDQTVADQLMAQGTINTNVDVPQGADVQLRWVDITGKLSVEGKLALASSQIEGNATVSGPGAGLSLFNDPGNHFWGNLTVNAAGGYYDGSWINTGLGVYSNGQQVDGNLTFTNNTGSRLALNGAMTVNGNFTYSANATSYTDTGALKVLGTPSIS